MERITIDRTLGFIVYTLICGSMSNRISGFNSNKAAPQNYPESELQSSVFLLNESNRQRMLMVFNWTGDPVQRKIYLPKIGIPDVTHLSATNVLTGKQCNVEAAGPALCVVGTFGCGGQKSSKIIDNSIPTVKPDVAPISTQKMGERTS